MGVATDEIVGKQTTDFFTGPNEWVLEKLGKLKETQTTDYFLDAELEFEGEKISVNLTVMPLKGEEKSLGSMIMIEDISTEKRMKSTMSRYMDPGLAERLMAGGEDLLGGNAVKATVLFSDIRGFTTITEELGPTGTVSLLNEYFTIMVDCIQREGGMLDKFIGDAIMAAFGLPIPKEDDEDRAVKAAISMIRDLREWNEKQIALGKRAIDMGVGLNTDTVVAGNIGSPKRMDYTMIGDGVNLASRLESACKSYSARILISDNTYKALQGTYRIRDVDDVVVKGKTEPVAVYEVLDYHTDATFPNIMEACGYFNEGRKHYRGGHWDKAIQSFNKVLDINGEDMLPRTYIGRCEELKADPPPEGEWKGVWVMKTK
jgi:adenylate cyclase